MTNGNYKQTKKTCQIEKYILLLKLQWTNVYNT